MTPKTLLYCVIGTALASFLQTLYAVAQSAKPEKCDRVIAPYSVINRDQLKEFLELSQYPNKERVQSVLGAPFCKLPNRDGFDRDAYPMEFDPETWLVVRYTGYWMFDYTFTVHNGR